jgi:hypothetical protein
MWTDSKIISLFDAKPAKAQAAAAPAMEKVPVLPLLAPVEDPLKKDHRGTAILLATAGVFALWFWNTAALKFFTVDQDTYGIFWPRRSWLLAHIAGGTAALLIGPIQLWLGLSGRRQPLLHGVLGAGYLLGVGTGSIAAFQLASHTDFGWSFSLGLASMAMAWLVSTALAAIAILRRLVEQHREWMVRSYVVTFGFVTFRLVVDILEVARAGTFAEQLTAASWICWSVPLLITEVILQGRKVFAADPFSAKKHDVRGGTI